MLAFAGSDTAHALEVVASIKPVHSLVAAVMEGAGEPALIVEGASSPHAYSMRPSQAAALETADVVFWIGPGLEAFLNEPLETLASNATIVSLTAAPGLTKLPLREGGAFEPHSDEEHDRADEVHDDGEDRHEEEGSQHAEFEEHAHANIDMHLWLDPENARAMVAAIAKALAEADPAHAQAYAANAAALDSKLASLVADIKDALAGVKNTPFIVFHDAYRYYENRFGLSAAGSITLTPGAMPGAARVSQIRQRIADLDAVCVFAEPQFEPKLLDAVTERTDARTGFLDPLGADIPDGPELYFRLIRNMTASFRECLSGQG